MISEKNKIGAILALAFFLRVTGISFGLPHLYHQDEPIIVNHAMSIGASGWNTHFFVIPPFTIYLLFVVQGVYFVLGKLFGVFPSASDFALAFLRDPSAVYLLGRLVLGVLFGTATVWALWEGTKRFFGKDAAFLAALFLAVLPMHVQHSHYIYADIALTFMTTLMLFALLAVAERPCRKNHLLFGLWAGLGAAAKYTALYFTPVLLIAHWIGHGREGIRLRNISKILLAAGGCIGIFLCIAPFTVLDWTNFHAQLFHQAKDMVNVLQGVGWVVGKGSVPYTWWFHLRYSILRGTGAGFVFLTAAGVVFLWRNSPNKAAVISAFILLYYGVSLYAAQGFARYMLPLTTPLALLAAVGLQGLRQWIKSRLLYVVFLAVVLAELLVPAAYSDALFLSRDTRTRCKEWFEHNVPAGTVVVVDSRFFGPPLTVSADMLREKLNGTDDALQERRLGLMLRSIEDKKTYETYLLSTPSQQKGAAKFLFSRPYVDLSEDALRRIGARYIIKNYGDSESDGNPDDPKRDLNLFFDSIADKLEPVALFSPYKDPARKISHDHDNTAAPHLPKEIFSRKSLGPYLEVYRIKDA